MVVLQPEALLPPVSVRSEVRVPAAVQQPPVVVADSAAAAVMNPVPVVHGVSVVQTGATFVLEVVALAAVNRVLVVPLVLEVIVPAVDLVSQVAFVLQVVMLPVHLVLEMPLVFQVVVALVLRVPVMLEVVVPPVPVRHVPVVDAVPVVTAMASMVAALQRGPDLRPCGRRQPVPAVVMVAARVTVTAMVGPGHGAPPVLLAGVRGEHLQRVRP